MRRLAIAILIWASLVATGYGAMPDINTAKILDLTHTLDKSTIYWPTESGFQFHYEHYGMTPGGYFYASGYFASPEHGGTHMDAPLHFNRDGASVDKVALTQTIGPAAVIDFSERAAKDPNATLMVADIQHYETAYGRIPDGAIVVARSGWGRFWPDRKLYMGTDKPGDVAGLRFPGFSPEAVNFMLKDRKVIALAIDTASMDPGISKDFPVHRLWLGANRPGFENLANADKLPPAGAIIFCVPMKIGGGTGAPARIFALLP
ncbi:MAG TPA: cyclase family protein [Candidatus Binataceae bacterium]|nr:cyclase family protein [Candidatus Binataceae bacterium]